MKRKFLFPNLLILIVILSCGSKAKSNIGHNEDSSTIQQSIDWSTILVDTLPFKYQLAISEYRSWEYNIESFFNHFGIKNRNDKLNVLFSDSTELYNAPFYSGHPNKVSGYFFKRFPDICGNRILLFVSLDKESDLEGGPKPINMELQTFDKDNQLIDKIIVYEIIPNECTWSRGFEYEKNFIEITDILYCVDINTDNNNVLSDSTVFHDYQIKDNGKIVRYYKQREGFYKDLDFKEEGTLKNHNKEGLWKASFLSEKKQLERVSFTTYSSGEKEGEALYYFYEYRRGWEGFILQYGEKYHKNNLTYTTENEYSDFSEFSIKPKCDNIIGTLIINKSVDQTIDE